MLNWVCLKSRHFWVVKILTTCLGLVACGGTPYKAPVSDLTQPPSQKIATHTVAKEETLYSIAWRYNLDVNQLAAANGISRPYTIYPGQLLSLDTSRAIASKPRSVSQKTSTSSRSSNQPSPTPKTTPAPKSKRQLSWQWPAQGPLLARYGGAQALSKGIDIGGKNGEPVLAAESGTVVYAGEGLRGYGKLLIIKHNDQYLSAYAHNQTILVAEGDSVKAGQQIAEIGSSGTNRDKLHFEIRRDGKPVDPMQYLPSR